VIVLQEKGHRAGIERLLFTPDGQGLLTTSYDGVHIWRDVPHSNICKQITDHRYARQVCITPDGRYLLTNQNSLTTTDLTTGDSWQVKLPEDWLSCFFDVTPDSRHVLLAQNSRTAPGAWFACRPVKERTPKAPLWSRSLPHQTCGPLVCVGNDRFVLTESWWDTGATRGVFRYLTCSTETGETLADVEGPEVAWSPAVVSPDGRLLAGLHNARVVVLAVADLSKAATTLRNDNRKHFTDVAFHPSGRFLAATSNDATVKLYDTTTWEVARTFTWDIGRMRSIAFSPDGTLAAAGSDKGKVVVWDVDV
jgi:WD40 repeat protein